MKERTIRLLHRRVGIFLALFILIQVASGTAISIYHLYGGGQWEEKTQHEANNALPVKVDETGDEESEFEEMLEFAHKKGGSAGDLYRTLLGFGIIFMAISGSMINREIKNRTKNRGKNA